MSAASWIALGVLVLVAVIAAAIHDAQPSARERELARLAWEQQLALWRLREAARQARINLRDATNRQPPPAP